MLKNNAKKKLTEKKSRNSQVEPRDDHILGNAVGVPHMSSTIASPLSSAPTTSDAKVQTDPQMIKINDFIMLLERGIAAIGTLGMHQAINYLEQAAKTTDLNLHLIPCTYLMMIYTGAFRNYENKNIDKANEYRQIINALPRRDFPTAGPVVDALQSHIYLMKGMKKMMCSQAIIQQLDAKSTLLTSVVPENQFTQKTLDAQLQKLNAQLKLTKTYLRRCHGKNEGIGQYLLWQHSAFLLKHQHLSALTSTLALYSSHSISHLIASVKSSFTPAMLQYALYSLNGEAAPEIAVTPLKAAHIIENLPYKMGAMAFYVSAEVQKIVKKDYEEAEFYYEQAAIHGMPGTPETEEAMIQHAAIEEQAAYQALLATQGKVEIDIQKDLTALAEKKSASIPEEMSAKNFAELEKILANEKAQKIKKEKRKEKRQAQAAHKAQEKAEMLAKERERLALEAAEVRRLAQEQQKVRQAEQAQQREKAAELLRQQEESRRQIALRKAAQKLKQKAEKEKVAAEKKEQEAKQKAENEKSVLLQKAQNAAKQKKSRNAARKAKLAAHKAQATKHITIFNQTEKKEKYTRKTTPLAPMLSLGKPSPDFERPTNAQAITPTQDTVIPGLEEGIKALFWLENIALACAHFAPLIFSDLTAALFFELIGTLTYEEQIYNIAHPHMPGGPLHQFHDKLQTFKANPQMAWLSHYMNSTDAMALLGYLIVNAAEPSLGRTLLREANERNQLAPNNTIILAEAHASLMAGSMQHIHRARALWNNAASQQHPLAQIYYHPFFLETSKKLNALSYAPTSATQSEVTTDISRRSSSSNESNTLSTLSDSSPSASDNSVYGKSP